MGGPQDAPDHVNLHEVTLVEQVAHGGTGAIRFARLLEQHDSAGACNFVDLAVVPPGSSIGRHRHAEDEEEFYLVLEGSGSMWRDGEQLAVRAGDLIRNRPGGEHGLHNSGTGDLVLFVFEVAVQNGSTR